MFLGDYKKKRNISLGGAKATLDKSHLIKEAAQERQKRERERQAVISASRIQGAWKSFKCRQAVYQCIRSEWDSQIAIEHTESLDDIVTKTAQLWFFYSPSKDKHRLAKWLGVLLQPASMSSPVPVFCILCNEASLGTRWKFLLAKCLDESIRLLLDLELGFDLHLSHVQLILQVSRLNEVLPINIELDLQDLLVQRMLQRGLFQKLRLLIVRCSAASTPLDEDTPSSSPWIFIFQLLQASKSHPRTLSLFIQQFIIHILSLPNALLSSKTSRIAPWLSLILRSLSAQELLQNSALLYHDSEAKLAVFINLLQVVGLSKSLTIDDTKTFAEALMHLLSSLPSSLFRTYLKSEDDDGTEGDVVMVDSSFSPQRDVLIDLLSNLLDSAFITYLLQGLEQNDFVYFGTVSSLLVALLSRLPAKKNETCNVLLFKTKIPLMTMLFETLKNGDLWERGLKRESEMTLLLEPQLEQEWSTLILFADLYSRSLLTMSDDEFFGTRNFLSVQDIISFSGVLKNLTFQLLWGESKVDSPYPALGVNLESISALFSRCLQQIHIRDSRKPFTPVDRWYVYSEQDNYIFTQPLLSMPDNMEFSQAKTLRESRIAACYQVLQLIPFVIPFETRVKLFRFLVDKDRKEHNIDPSLGPVSRITIHRNKVFEDGFSHMNALGSRLKGKIAITFISEHGLEEAGIDGGGVFKEFLTSLSKEAFNENCGLFTTTHDRLLYPCPFAYAKQDQQLSHFEFLGRIIGKALYEGVLVDVAFADFFLAKWIGRQGFLDDLPSLDPELYQGLLFLKQYQGNVEDLGVDFTITEQEFGESRNVDLIPNGSNIPVTNDNRIQYIYLSAHYKVNLQIKRQCEAFFKGLKDLIEPSWIRMFNQQELQLLLGGVATPIDLKDLQKSVVYSGGYALEHPTIQMFWEIVSNFTEDQKRDLVKFITSCPRPPLLGFGELRPAICVRSAGFELDRLPTASTCMNLLKLPEYQDKASFKQKLEYAISAGAGFDLS